MALFFRDNEGRVYKVVKTLAENQFIEGEIQFNEETFIVSIISEDSRVPRIDSKIYVNEFLTETVKSERDFSIAKYTKIGEPFSLKVVAFDPYENVSLIRPIEKEFSEIVKTETFPEEFTVENQTATAYLGLDENIVMNSAPFTGFGANFTKNSTNGILSINIPNISYFGANSFRDSKVDIQTTVSNVPLTFGDNSFRNYSGNLSFGDGLIQINSIGNNAFYGSSLKNLNIDNTNGSMNIGNSSFAKSQIESIYIKGSKERANLPFFKESAFQDCMNLVSVTGDWGFNYRGTFPNYIFSNCTSLEVMHDMKDRMYGKSFSVLELGRVGRDALKNCSSLPKKNLFILYKNSEVIAGSLSGIENATFLHPENDGLSREEVIQKFNLPESSYVHLYHEYYFLRNSDSILYLWHQQKPHIYQYILKYVSDEEEFSFCSWLGHAPYQICTYAFTFTPIKSIFIPEGTHRIESKAFYGCEDLEIRLGDYEPGQYWEEDWNLKSIDSDGNKIYHNVIWNAKG